MNFLTIIFILFIAFIIIIGESQKRKKEKNRIQPRTSKVEKLVPGFVEVKGKLLQIQTVISPMTKSECIGYNYSTMHYTSSGTLSLRSRDRGLTYSKR